MIFSRQINPTATALLFEKEQADEGNKGLTFESLNYQELIQKTEDQTQVLNQKFPKKSVLLVLAAPTVKSIVDLLAARQSIHAFIPFDKSWSEEQLSNLMLTYQVQGIVRNGVIEPSADSKKAPPAVHPDLKILLTTSGSTGSPKLVRLTEKNLSANAESIVQYLKIQSSDRTISTLPFSYSFGLSILNSYLLAGASIVLTDKAIVSKEFWQSMKENKVSSLSGVPTILKMLSTLGLKRLSLENVRTITQAGGKLDLKTWEQLQAFCQEKGISFYPMYGQTEATARISFLEPEFTKSKMGSIGKAIPGGNLWLEDQGQKINSANQKGELIYQGPNVMMGYAQVAEDLALGDVNQSILKTGDLGYFDDEGFYFITGRAKRFIKINSQRTSLDEIESQLAQAEMQVICSGEDEMLRVLTTSSPEKVLEYLTESLRIPKYCVEVRGVNEFICNNNGKIDLKKNFEAWK